MAATATTTTTLTEMVQAEVLNQAIKDYLIDANVIMPIVEYQSIAGKNTKALSTILITKDTGADITEGTAMTVDDLDSSDVSITVAQVGIYRQVTEFVSQTNMLGKDGLFNLVVNDGIALVLEMVEDDLAALFASATGATVGTSGVDMSVTDFVTAVAKMRTIKVRGKYVCVLDDQQGLDFMNAVAASTAAVLGGNGVDQSVLNAGSDGYLGSFMNVPIWVTNLTDTANAGADVVGSMFSAPGGPKNHSPYTLAELWGPKVAYLEEPTLPSYQISTTMAYGVGITHPTAAIKIVTDA